MEKNKEFGLIFIKKPIGISKIYLLLMVFLIVDGAYSFLLKFLGEFYVIIFAGLVLPSLPFSVINIRLKKINNNVIYANLAGFVLPFAVACYFLAIITVKLNLLIIIASATIASIVEIKRTKVSRLGSGGRILYVVVTAIVLAMTVPFSVLPGNNLLLLRLLFAYMIVIFATVNSDLFHIHKHRTKLESGAISIGGKGIFDGIWVGGYLAIVVLLILYNDGYLDLAQQTFTWGGF